MMNCKDLENKLPLYPDNLLSDEEKQSVEKHLKACSKCAKTIEQMQKTGQLVKNLNDVEPPPWFKQKIMAAVREEAAKKSFIQKWFYPLHIKIPVQIMATIVVAVFAVYIYRSGEEQLKTVLPPSVKAPVTENQKDHSPEQKLKPSRDKLASPQDVQNKEVAVQNLTEGAGVSQTRERQKTIIAGNDYHASMDSAKEIKRDSVMEEKDRAFTPIPEQKSQASKSAFPSAAAPERKKESYALGASGSQSAARDNESIVPRAVIALLAVDSKIAATEVETILNKYGAQKVIRQARAGKVFLTAEIRGQTISDFISEIKKIGPVVKKAWPAENAEGDVPMLIEITSH